MTTTIEVSDEAAADVLTRAADHMERVGLHKGDMYNTGLADTGVLIMDCQVCTWGALYFALQGWPRYGIVDPEKLALADRVADALLDHLGLDGSDYDVADPIAAWSDDPDRTKDEVVNALRETAASLVGGA